MKIAEVNISDELMGQLVYKLFTCGEINRKRGTEAMIQSTKRKPWHLRRVKSYIPHLSVTLNAKIDIKEEDVMKFFKEFSKKDVFESYPYFSLTSENSKGGLQVFLNSYTENEGVNVDDLSLKTEFYILQDKIYYFKNLRK